MNYVEQLAGLKEEYPLVPVLLTVHEAQAVMCGHLTQETYDLGFAPGKVKSERFVAIRYQGHTYNAMKNVIEPFFLTYNRTRFIGHFYYSALEDIVME